MYFWAALVVLIILAVVLLCFLFFVLLFGGVVWLPQKKYTEDNFNPKSKISNTENQ